MSSNPSISARVEKSAELLSVQSKVIVEALKKAGIEDNPSGLALLNASTTTPEDLVSILQDNIPLAKKLQLKAAAAILKGDDPLAQSPEPRPVKVESIADIIKASRPIEQWSDRELIDQYLKERLIEVEQELSKRAKNQPWVILKPGKYEPGKEEIDIDASMDLLKMARKGKTNPTIIPCGESVSPVYRITELNLQDRIIEICPICGGSLWKGYCEKCAINFATIGDDERAYVYLISKSDTFKPESYSDRKAVAASARAGLDDLKLTWPSIFKKFEELKVTNNLPKLRIIENRPSQQVADPFFHDGNRAFGNRKF